MGPEAASWECGFPTCGYFVSGQRKLLYCPIQKVASSSIKLWWAKLEEGSHAKYAEVDGLTPPDCEGAKWGYVAHHKMEGFTFWHHRHQLGRRPLDDDSWFRFAFVRNPWARVVSCFLNKFIKPHPVS